MNTLQQLPTQETFHTLPIVAEGNSKEVRYMGSGIVAIKLKPTVYSYTHNRAGEIIGTDDLRMRSSKALLEVVAKAGAAHTYQGFNDGLIISELVMPESTGELNNEFVPTDLTLAQRERLARAAPIEVIVKRFHAGTPKHRYFGMNGTTARSGIGIGSGQHIKDDARYPQLVTRFDWRNPMTTPAGERLADEVLPECMANWYIDVEQASLTARAAFGGIERALGKVGLELWDMCFFITEDGKQIFSEISPDCMRVRSQDESLDKDVWRSGGSSELVTAKWTKFVEIVEQGKLV